jgi:hypothetical protein
MPPRVAKLLAVIAAIVMIGVALLVRSNLGDDDGGPGGDGGSRETFEVVCITELASICEELEPEGLDVTVEDAGTTAARLASETSDIDAWVTIDPWPEMVDVERRLAQLPELFTPATSPAVASSDLVLLLAGETDPECGWNCVVVRSGEQQEIGVPANNTGFGLQVIGEAFASHMDTAEFSLQDIRDESQWLGRLLASEPSVDAELRMATQGTAAYIGAGTTEQRANTVLDTEGGRVRKLHLGAVEVPARADVVVASLAGSDSTDRLKGIFTGQNARAAFTAEGWTAPAGEGPTGLPAADLLVALREETDR